MRPPGRLEVSVDSTIDRAHQRVTNLPGTQWDLANYTNLREELPDNAIGRSRGGLSTKIHHLCDGNMRPLVMLLGPGQGGDSLMSSTSWTPFTFPDYSSRANRRYLRRRGVRAVIPERSGQIADRKRRGAKGGRPVTYETEAYKRRNVVERSLRSPSNGARWPSATTSSH